LQRQYRDIDQKAGEICTAQVILQPTIPKSDRLLDDGGTGGSNLERPKTAEMT